MNILFDSAGGKIESAPAVPIRRQCRYITIMTRHGDRRTVKTRARERATEPVGGEEEDRKSERDGGNRARRDERRERKKKKMEERPEREGNRAR